MIARVDGQIVLVAGAIPGERVTARVDRVGKGVAYAQTVAVDEPSPDRRAPFTDPLCGGCGYAHVAYARQVEIKAQVIADAFHRIGRLELPEAVRVRPSPDEGYRMRARLHLRDGRVGFFREGTHDICDARATRQLLPATSDALDHLANGLRSLGAGQVAELELSENSDASGRAVHLIAASQVESRALAALASSEGFTGVSVSSGSGPIHILGGDPFVTDVLALDGHTATLRRHVLAFFQANRFLLRDLVADVVGRLERGSTVVDLYAGVGVFAVAAAVARDARVIAVEGDVVAARDLEANARTAGGGVEAVHQAVESFCVRQPIVSPGSPGPDTVIVDPPRTGMSKEALEGAIRLGARRVLYVSCDVATLARDSRRLADSGYRLTRIDAFDLFPNTPHVETIVEFENLRM